MTALKDSESSGASKEKEFEKDIHNRIVTQVQAQVNYFRFLFKLLKKIHNYLKT